MAGDGVECSQILRCLIYDDLKMRRQPSPYVNPCMVWDQVLPVVNKRGHTMGRVSTIGLEEDVACIRLLPA